MNCTTQVHYKRFLRLKQEDYQETGYGNNFIFHLKCNIMNLSYRWLELYFPPRKIMHEGSQNMKDYMKIYQEWLANPYFDDKTKEELRAIANDENEIKERFYMDLEFGTAGLRGIIGAGINRMNIYTVRRATQGLANYIIKQGGADKGVAIAFDSRHMSPNLPWRRQ